MDFPTDVENNRKQVGWGKKEQEYMHNKKVLWHFDFSKSNVQTAHLVNVSSCHSKVTHYLLQVITFWTKITKQWITTFSTNKNLKLYAALGNEVQISLNFCFKIFVKLTLLVLEISTNCHCYLKGHVRPYWTLLLAWTLEDQEMNLIFKRKKIWRFVISWLFYVTIAENNMIEQ